MAGALKCHNSAHCLFLDLSKAFDFALHLLLLLKLEALGITGNISYVAKEFLDCSLSKSSHQQ